MLQQCYTSRALNVALLTEGVDRNFVRLRRSRKQIQSPSSRRAWIEIITKRMGIRDGASRPPHGGRG